MEINEITPSDSSLIKNYTDRQKPFDGKQFQLVSSYGPDSPEVKKMAKAQENGIPVVLYEFMQGMVDYGKDHDPPPRIWMEYKSGKKESFNGLPLESDHDPITAIEFCNAGPGLSPEDLVINRHGGGETTLGTYGKGLTLALTYLESLGIQAKVSSHYRDLSWSGSTLLMPTETAVTEILALKGSWGKSNNQGSTRIRLDNPPDWIIESLSKAGEAFLYANPRFPDAVIVPRDEETISLVHKPISIDQGKVTPLTHVVPDKEEYSEIYVDGLCVKMGNGKTCLFPWSIQGFSHAHEPYYRACRSHDSTSVIAKSLPTLLTAALLQIEDESSLQKYISHALEYSYKYAEFSHAENPPNQTLSPVTSGLIKRIWERDYKNALIEHEEHFIELYKTYFPDQQDKILKVPYELYKFLSAAGVKKVDRDMLQTEARNQGELMRSQIERLSNIRVPSATQPYSLERLINRVAYCQGSDADLTLLNGKKFLRLSLPYTVNSTEEFDGQSEDNTGMLIRIAAVVASTLGIECKIFTLDPESLNNIEIKVQNLGDDSYHTDIDITSFDRRKFPEYASYKLGATYILLSGDQIDSIKYPGLLEKLIELFLAKAKELSEKLKKLHGLKRKGLAANHKPLEPTISHQSVGQIDVFPVENNTLNGLNLSKHILPPGYYQSGIGTTLSYDPRSKSVMWRNIEKWASVSIPRKKPRSYSAKLIIPGLCGIQQLLVKTGEKIIAYEAGDDGYVNFFRETRTGLYSVQGSAQKLTYYTAPAHPDELKSYQEAMPLAEEYAAPVDYNALSPETVMFVYQILKTDKNLNPLEKVALLHQFWNDKFTYTRYPGINDLIEGASMEEVVAKILNLKRGICNVSATGFAAMLRLIGIPSRVCSGFMVERPGHGGTHMWVEYWDNNYRWTPAEPNLGIGSETSFMPQKRLIHSISTVHSARAAVYTLISLICLGSGVFYMEHKTKQFKRIAEQSQKLFDEGKKVTQQCLDKFDEPNQVLEYCRKVLKDSQENQPETHRP